MSKRQKPRSEKLNVAAERTGRALGEIARTFDGLKARHPHPVEEAREALAKGRARVVKTTNAAAKKTQKVVKRVKKAVKGARKAVKSAQKAAQRSASRLKR